MDQNQYLSKFNFPLLSLSQIIRLLNYERIIRSLLLIIINATAITPKTKVPATKLDKKFANEGVILNSKC